ncbi:phospho-sugar mutase [Brevibacillus sp. GCM10020057]|uniref:phospho-sugar mutase n=1 Tax=Brevibacillus sp. GCM10020057 TaxID=3317327 RepID=UPI00363E296A
MFERNDKAAFGSGAMEEYSRWLAHQGMPADLLEELEQIRSSREQIEDRFEKDLEFGTGGMRGIIGAGRNRLNVYTVRKAALGIARFLQKKGKPAMKQGVAIAYDSRKYSKEFAHEMAALLAHSEITVYLFAAIAPTPLLSFAIRHLHASAGIVLTASHNPPEYNGIKVYNRHGGQITEQDAQDIYTEMQQLGDPLLIAPQPPEGAARNIILIGEEVILAYSEQVLKLLRQRPLLEKEGHLLSIVYTPLHGTGYKIVPDLLAKAGFTRVRLVEQQAVPDPRFPTVRSPNPEEREAFVQALQLAEQTQADLIMATDPDADRLGVLVRTDTGYERLNGNQLGALLLYYLLQSSAANGERIHNGLMLKTIVTSDLGEKIARTFGVRTENTLTGFKYIGEKIEECCTSGPHTFVFGYEESYGYLAGDFVRDKDAVQIAVLVAEMALFYRKQGRDLFAVLEEIYGKYGYFCEALQSLTIAGKEGREQMEKCMAMLRTNPPGQIAGYAVLQVEDYERQVLTVALTRQMKPLTLPKSNVLKFVLEDGSWLAVRPSGTEPKMKVYVSSCSPNSREEAEAKLVRLQGALTDLIRFF